MTNVRAVSKAELEEEARAAIRQQFQFAYPRGRDRAPHRAAGPHSASAVRRRSGICAVIEVL